jgi:hypothetical protein
MRLQLAFHGLTELRRDLMRLPMALAGEGGHIIEDHGNAAAVAIRTGYGRHRVTGNLQESVDVVHEASALSARSKVTAHAPHAHLFEYGTEARHYTSKRGAPHGTGRMWGRTPPVKVFIPEMQRARVQMYAALRAMLERHGLRVSGDAGQ